MSTCVGNALHLPHDAKAALRHTRSGDDKGANNDQDTAESPSLRERSRVEDLAGNGRANQQTDGDNCRETLAIVAYDKGYSGDMKTYQ